jgi:hypothetical protein
MGDTTEISFNCGRITMRIDEFRRLAYYEAQLIEKFWVGDKTGNNF